MCSFSQKKIAAGAGSFPREGGVAEWWWVRPNGIDPQEREAPLDLQGAPYRLRREEMPEVYSVEA